MRWYLLQAAVFGILAWSDMTYHWSGWKHGDPVMPIILIALAAMWSVTFVVSKIADLWLALTRKSAIIERPPSALISREHGQWTRRWSKRRALRNRSD